MASAYLGIIRTNGHENNTGPEGLGEHKKELANGLG